MISGGLHYLTLVILLSLFRVTQLLKFLIPIQIFFDLNKNGTLTIMSTVLLTVLIVALVLEATYQVLNQSLRYKIAKKFIDNNLEAPKLTVLSFTKASSELIVSSLAVSATLFIIGCLSIITAGAFFLIFVIGSFNLLGRYEIQKHTHKFEKISDVREIMVSSYAVLSMAIATLVYFYDWWHAAELTNFILGFLLLRFMVNTSVSLLREYLIVNNHLKHKVFEGIKQ
jgi:hypothetical protein